MIALRPAFMRLLDFGLPGMIVLFWMGLLWVTGQEALIWHVPAFLVSFGLYTVLLPTANHYFQFARGARSAVMVRRALALLGVGAVGTLMLYVVVRGEISDWGALGAFWLGAVFLVSDQFLAPIDRVISDRFVRSVAIKWGWLALSVSGVLALVVATGVTPIWAVPVMLAGLLAVRLWSMAPDRVERGLMGAVVHTLGRFSDAARNVHYSYGALWALNAFGIVIANFDLLFFVATSPVAAPFLLLTALRFVSVAVNFFNMEKSVLAFSGDWGSLRRVLGISAGFVLVCLGALFWVVGALEGVDLGIYLASQFLSILLLPFWTYLFLAGYIPLMLGLQIVFLGLVGAAFAGIGLGMEEARLLGFTLYAVAVVVVFARGARVRDVARARGDGQDTP